MGKYILIGAGCLVVGFFAGFFVSNNLNRGAALQTSSGAQNPANPPFLNQQTQVASVKESTSGAMMPDVAQTLDQAKNQPESFEAQMRAGEMYQKIQNFEKAGVYFDAAAILKPTDRAQQVRLGNAFFDIRQFEKAETFYDQALEKKPDDIAVRTDLGITFLERQNPDYDRAIKEFQESLKLNPKHEPTLYNISAAYYRKGDQENAQKYLAELEQANPKSPLIERLKQTISAK
ncbi:MAG TPA: tetratricopeptide repeat protein [Pyrinomonadaceae bacterium]|jgi:tetratricopeptide (TPR) repeat protein